MSQKLLLLCPLINWEMCLKGRFGNDSYFLTASGSVFDHDIHAYTEALIHLLPQEDISGIYHVHDIEFPLLRSIVHHEETNNSVQNQILATLHAENYPEIIKEPNKIASLALIYMKHQANLLLHHPRIASIIIENKNALQGLLSQISKRKSIQFDLKMAFQKL